MKTTTYLFLIIFILTGCAKRELADTNLQKTDQGQTQVPERATFAIPNDPFTPYFTSVPTVVQTISTTNSGSGATAITTKRFTFSSKNGANTVFAIMAYPQAAGTYPAILFNHGGGGNAETMAGNVNTYAAKGYVTLAIDIPGIAGTTNTPNSTGAWKSVTGEAPRLNVSGGPQSSTLFDAGVGGLQAFNYLAAQANVDNTKMAISGTSWGGYMTTLLTGILGTRVKAAYSIYGSGFYDRGSFWSTLIANMTPEDRTVWKTYLDAGRRCPYITAPYFVAEPSNDTYFWPEAIQATLDAIPGTKNHVVMPNLNHADLPAGGTMKQIYLDYYLKGVGAPFGSIQILNTVPQGDGSLQINFQVNLAPGTTVSSVQLYYSVPAATWQQNNWVALAATLVSGTNYRANIPASIVNQDVNYYGYFVDSRTVATSTSVYQTGYLDRADATIGWGSGNAITINSTDKKEGAASLQSVGSGTDEFKRNFTTSYSSVVYPIAGYLTFWYYVSDVTKLSTTDQIELGSGGAPDINEYSWRMGPRVNGWNFISKPFSEAAVTGGAPNINAFNWFRIYHSKTASVTTRVDGIQIMR